MNKLQNYDNRFNEIDNLKRQIEIKFCSNLKINEVIESEIINKKALILTKEKKINEYFKDSNKFSEKLLINSFIDQINNVTIFIIFDFRKREQKSEIYYNG